MLLQLQTKQLNVFIDDRAMCLQQRFAFVFRNDFLKQYTITQTISFKNKTIKNFRRFRDQKTH